MKKYNLLFFLLCVYNQQQILPSDLSNNNDKVKDNFLSIFLTGASLTSSALFTSMHDTKTAIVTGVPLLCAGIVANDQSSPLIPAVITAVVSYSALAVAIEKDLNCTEPINYRKRRPQAKKPYLTTIVSVGCIAGAYAFNKYLLQP